MRCPDCNKFVSFGEAECENESVDTSGSNVEVQVTVNLPCGDCGTTLKSASIEASGEIEHTCPGSEREGPDFEVEDEGSPSGTDRYQTTDRHGKPIKNSRYMRHYYGFETEVEVKCNRCGETVTVQVSGEEQASAFEEQV